MLKQATLSTKQPIPLSEDEAVEIMMKAADLKYHTAYAAMKAAYRALLAATSVKPTTVSDDELYATWCMFEGNKEMLEELVRLRALASIKPTSESTTEQSPGN